MDAILAKNLSKSFTDNKKEVFAVKNIDLKIKSGQIYGFLGPNGAGKTTTIYMLSTLLLPTSGKAEVLGYDANSESSEIRKRIGLCISSTYFYGDLTPKEILSFYGMMMGLKRSKRASKIDEVSKDFNMQKFMDKRFLHLSTGMKQKVALAKSILNDPEVLFLDEPTNGLDVEIAHDIRNYIRDKVNDTGMTALLTSHHLYEVEDLCKRISIINEGKIISEGNILDVKRNVSIPDIARIVLNDYSNLDFLKKLPFFIDSEFSENGLLLKFKGGPDSVTSLLDEIKKNKKKVLDIEIRKASLEEVFMKIVGGKDG